MMWPFSQIVNTVSYRLVTLKDDPDHDMLSLNMCNSTRYTSNGVPISVQFSSLLLYLRPPAHMQNIIQNTYILRGKRNAGDTQYALTFE